RLMTAHGAKGLEFDYVFLVNVTDGHWGNKRSRELFRLPSLALAAYEEGDEPERSEGLHAVEREPRLKGATIVSRIGAPEGAKRLKGATIVSRIGAPEGAKRLKGVSESPDALDEERRLFYVALTRARRMVYLSHADEDLEGRERRPSQFLLEMKPELLAEGDGAAYEEAAALVPAPAVLRPASGLLARDRATLREFFYERPLSATALNNFLACPWRYFYTNLVRMPRADTRAQRYGLAVHGALKDFFDALRNAPAPKAYLTDAFVRALERKALTESEFGELTGKGLRVLEGYYERYHESWCTATENEFRVRGVELPARVLSRPLALSGIIDKIEYLGPDAVNVVDYKTGRPRSRAAIEGKTKHGDGGYKRQLVFYKLLLERGTGLTMTGAELDFIEPDKRGVFHRERFLVDDAEVEELTELIYEVAEKITGFSFWDERCGQKDCAFCALRNEMQ
ncbi:MAG: PD-(D/E)XK nuclease family protein, partial [bacterium]|nr:PD-(D/E)XK nuclease family protein [bacterium]